MARARSLRIAVEAGLGSRADPRASTGHALEARLTRGEGTPPLAVIGPPHPLYGGTIGNPVVRALERAFEAAGHATLAFNFRGTGESDGQPSGELDDALVDYLAAARSVPDQPPAWLSGYSFGSIAALSAAIELGTPRVLMVAPPLSLLESDLIGRYRGFLGVAVGSEDEYVPVGGLRVLLGSHPPQALQVQVIEDVGHFFLGSAVESLSGALRTLLSAGEGHK